MKKIAIITHYYESINYGGNLQAYALCKYLNSNGFYAEQISYSCTNKSSRKFKKGLIYEKIKNHPVKSIMSIMRIIINKILDIFHKKNLLFIKDFEKKRYDNFKHFQLDLTPHTKDIYTDETLYKLNDEFDYFITGSDQVFNFSMARDGYFLNFVSKGKTKFSYAASMALNKIPEERKKFMFETLKEYKAVGVRETRTQHLLSDLTKQEIYLNIDPVFLLDKTEWEKITSTKHKEKDYIFCYFLGNNVLERKCIKAFSKNNNLDIICIPAYKTRYRIPDLSFGSTNLPFASPEDFVSLIKNAKYVFTDSFHACAFSIIFNKQFVVFNRNKKESLSSRIESLMELFSTENRFVKNECLTVDYVSKILHGEMPNYSTDKYRELLESSKTYLELNLN